MSSPVRYRIDNRTLDSRLLEGNPLGDPAGRALPVLTPEGTPDEAVLPLVLVLAAYSSPGYSLLVDEPWSEGFPARVERLHRAGHLGPMRYAFPDCFTRLGGSQYLDSDATGPYERYLWEEVVPSLRARYGVGRVGLVGRSSGGYGALVQAMRHPEEVAAVCCHAGDMAFEWSCLPELPRAQRWLRRFPSLEAFLAEFEASPKKRSGDRFAAINVVAMAACYSPDPAEPLGIALPFDLESGALREGVWARWLAHDPVRLVDDWRCAEALSRLRLLFLDAGTRDEYALDIGARMLAARLRRHNVAHVHEEFDDGHMGTAYRYDVSLPRLHEALAG